MRRDTHTRECPDRRLGAHTAEEVPWVGHENKRRAANDAMYFVSATASPTCNGTRTGGPSCSGGAGTFGGQ
jgi:hypothetical protein